MCTSKGVAAGGPLAAVVSFMNGEFCGVLAGRGVSTTTRPAVAAIAEVLQLYTASLSGFVQRPARPSSCITCMSLGRQETGAKHSTQYFIGASTAQHITRSE
jgi:hypothetical protein